MRPNKKQSILYSLWMIPVIFAGLLYLLFLVNIQLEAQYTYESLRFISPLIFIGYLFAAVTSKQKKDWSLFFIFVAAFCLIIALSNAFGSANMERGFLIGNILFLVYAAAGCVVAFLIRQRVIAGAVYARSDEYKQLKEAENMKRYQQEFLGVKNPGGKKQKDAAPAGSALAGAFTGGPAAAEAVKPAEVVKPAVAAAPAEAAKPAAPAVNAYQDKREIDVNTCSIEQLVALPGITLAEAKRVIQERETNGEYASVEDFISRSGWKPHTVARFIDELKVSHAHDEVSYKRRGRSLDL